MALLGAVVFYVTVLTNAFSGRKREPLPSVLVAAEAERMLTWDIEQGQKSKNILKIAGEFVGLEDEDSTTLKRRALSHPDLVAEFRDMLQ